MRTTAMTIWEAKRNDILDDGYCIIMGLLEIAGMALDEVMDKAPGYIAKAQLLASVLKEIGACIMDELAYWVPLLAGRLAFWLIWCARPRLVILSGRASRKAMAFARGLKDLWAMRRELIDEYKEVEE